MDISAASTCGIGADFPLQPRATPALDPEGAVTSAAEAHTPSPELQLIYETAPIGLGFLTTDCRYVLINQRLTEICGISVADHIGRSVRETVPAVAEQVEHIVQQILRTGEPMIGIEVNGQRPDKSNAERVWMTYWHPLKDLGRQIIGINVVAEEITERKRAEAALATSEARFLELADNMSQFAWTADSTGSRTWFNKRWYDYTGTAFAEIEGWKWQNVHHPDHVDRAIRRIQESCKTGAPWEDTFPLRGRDGTYRWFLTRAVPIRDPKADVLRWFGTHTDITGQIEAEKALRKLNETLAERVEAQARERDRIWTVCQDLLVVAGKDGRIVSMNPAWTTTLGWDESDLLGKTTGWLIHPEDREKVRAELAGLVAGQTTRQFDTRLRRKDGSYCWLSWRAVLDHNLVYAVARDVTELRQAEEQLRATRQELAQVSRQLTMRVMTASIAHEVSQPLGAIVANANAGLRWLAKAEPDFGRVQTILEKIVNEGHRMTEMVAGIRAMFVKDHREATPVNVKTLISDTLGLTRAELEIHRILLQTEIPEELPDVMAERVQLQQVLFNLINNAIDTMSSIEGRNRQLIIKSEICEPYDVKIMIEDSGHGIPPDHMGRIFEPFFTTKQHGMGMGLSICQSIIELFDGHLWAEPRKPHGTVFYIRLRTAAKPSDIARSNK